MKNKNFLYQGLLKQYVGNERDYFSKLNIYFNNSVGIGEHPDITLEMDQMLDKLAGAHNKKNALIKHFDDYNFKKTKYLIKDNLNKPVLPPINSHNIF